MLVRDNPERHRYEAVDDDGEFAGFIDYRKRADRYWFIHTEIDEAHQGSGTGAFLVRKALDDVREKGALVIPACPFVAAWIRRHPDYRDLIDDAAWRDFKRSRNHGRRTVRPSRPAAEPCSHVPADHTSLPEPWPPDGCAECIAAGKRDWVHLRFCLLCGHVGCCDNSPGRHGTAHARQSDHPLIRSYEPGESWWYCYVDLVTFEVADAPPAPSYR